MDEDKTTPEPNEEEVEVEPSAEEPKTEEPEVETPEPAEPEPEEPEPEEKPPSRREQLRIQQVIAKAKSGGFTPRVEAPKGIDYAQTLDADPETIKKLEDDRKQMVDAERASSVRQAEAIQFRTLLEIDTPKIETKYPLFNSQDKENFNPAVSDAVNSWYLATVGWDPQTNLVQNANVRYGDFVEGVMELAKEIADQKVSSTSKNIARQSAQTGIRPDGSQAKRLNLNQAPENMSDEELKAIIGQAIPHK